MTMTHTKHRGSSSLQEVYDLEAKFHGIKNIPDELLKPFQERDKEIYQRQWKQERTTNIELERQQRLDRERKQTQARLEAEAMRKVVAARQQREEDARAENDRILRLAHQVKHYWMLGDDDASIGVKVGLKKYEVYNLTQSMKQHGLLPEGHREPLYKATNRKTGDILNGTVAELMTALGVAKSRITLNSALGWQIKKTGKVATVKDDD